MKTAVVAAALLVAAWCSSTAGAKPKPDSSTSIGPGALAVSAEEKAIVADAPAGTEHAVILLEETDCNENLGSGFQIAYHLRAKILSNEGRDLANVEVPMERPSWKLKRWWGRAIAPDGRTFELKETELQQQAVIKAGGMDRRVLKGLIPGVEPGTVIDYGYVLGGNGYYDDDVLELQRRFAIQRLRYRWTPYAGWQGEYVVHGSESSKVSKQLDGHSILIEAHDLRPVTEEPYMPPDAEVRTTVTFFYSMVLIPQQFWILVGGTIDAMVEKFGPKDKSLQLTMGQMQWPQGADLGAKVRFAYDWVGRNIRSTGTMSAEDFETIASRREERKLTARTVLYGRFGSPIEVSLLYASFVRALGAEARLVLAVDRRQRYWDPQIKSLQQFEYCFVEVKLPGEPDDKAVVVDPSSGLPYGELPWPATGTHAIVGIPDGFRATALVPTMADRNVGATEVALTFAADGDALHSTWSFVGQGQQGRDARARLRGVTGEERADAIDALCASGGWEVREAAAPELEERAAPFKLACVIESGATSFDASLETHSMTLPGPWWPDVPEFTSATRRQPVIFPFPRTDVVRADVAAPPGFAAADPPAPVTLEAAVGSYAMTITTGERGFHVERRLVIKPVKVSPEGYEGLRKFFADVARADRTPLTFRRSAPR